MEARQARPKGSEKQALLSEQSPVLFEVQNTSERPSGFVPSTTLRILAPGLKPDPRMRSVHDPADTVLLSQWTE